LKEVDGIERTLALSSVGCELPLRGVYRRVLGTVDSTEPSSD